MACSLEGAGKRRIFAIGQCNNVSYILYTIGQCGSYPDLSVMEPSDGPIHRLRLKRPLDVFSFDLSSATDRWPVSIIHDVVACMFGPTLASCIVNGSLALSAFDAPGRNICCFTTGQPLGYYGSWAFSLSHHVVVWLAAWLVDRWITSPFTDYALLGDDIVIADEAVAQQSRELLNKLDVSISESKSEYLGREH